MTDTSVANAALRADIANAIDELCRWAVRTLEQPLPGPARHKARMVLIDDLAATFASRGEPELVTLREQARPGDEATMILPGAPRTDKMSAARLNGLMGCWAELDEGYRGVPAHAAIYILPALLAEAEAQNTTTAAVIDKLAVAYELVARIAETWRFAAATIHPHAALAGIGAAIGASLGRGVAAPVMADALKIASGLVPAGTYEAAVEGALVRNIWTSHGAITGIHAVDWAQAGLSGFPDGPFTAFTGLLNAETDAGALLRELGTRWAILSGYHKLHGCCHSTHCAVEAALDLRARLGPEAATADITAIRLRTHRPMMSNRSPHNSLAARFSFEHVVAAALVVGHAGPDAFSLATIHDAEVARLRHLITLARYEPLPAWPQDRPAHLVATFADGTSMEAECLSAPGGPDRPLDAEGVIAKADVLTREAAPHFASSARALMTDDTGTIRQTLADLLRSA